MWYVRPKTGGQYGPAAGNMMQQWLDAGRVGPDSLVWREGWPQWKAAAEVFARFGAPPDSGPVQNPQAGFAGGPTASPYTATQMPAMGQPAHAGVPTGTAAFPTNLASNKREAERRRSLHLAVGGIVVLSLALIGIVSLLFYVLFSR